MILIGKIIHIYTNLLVKSIHENSEEKQVLVTRFVCLEQDKAGKRG